ncbi:MAG: glucans biosynthesis glucosyltransferase MdoH [Gammaproteobacteria bacterium]|nr:glucans biosynthesis glucosyltransferase MdoH [Gammaproteobacteria bacterium]
MTPARPSQRARTMPAIHRGAMVPRPWVGFTRGLLQGLSGALRREPPRAATPAPAPWEQAARWRRRLLLSLVMLSSGLATWVLSSALPTYRYPALQWLQTGLFTLLFAWVSAGCVTAVMGFRVLLFGDRHALSARSLDRSQPIDASARTALVMPICNEDVTTVFAGLRATCESLANTVAAGLFDLYVLSDTSDPALQAQELTAWAALRDTLAAHPMRVHYRHRIVRTKRKAGNVADFCRRWGCDHRYMVVLDADSVMSGDALVTLVRLMEAHPQAGILQTQPHAVGLSTVHARTQQFAARVTGRLFAAGMQYWQLGEAHYWGHNAIIRVAPFMAHCALAPLPGGRGGLGGDILSHDFVEAALMRRAGHHVWLVSDLSGSYEQQPPDLLTELQRDRRWCQGNLQNAQLIAEPGLHAVHRGMLATGAMAYLSAPLWLAYVALGVGLWLSGGNALFDEHGALTLKVLGLWVGTVAMLLLPRALGVAAVLLRGEQRQHGGTWPLIASSVLEAGLSAVQAPLRMVAHTFFVLIALTGWRLEWRSPPREAQDLGWREAARPFAVAGALAAAATVTLLLLHSSALWWLLPMTVPLMLAAPITVWTSQSSAGQRLKQLGLLIVPEEAWTPSVLRRAWAHARVQRSLTANPPDIARPVHPRDALKAAG